TLEASRDAGAADRDVDGVRDEIAGRAVALVAQAIPGARHPQLLGERLVLALDDRADPVTAIVDARRRRYRLSGRDRISRRRPRMVEVPRCEVRDRRAPETLSARVERGERLPLGGGDAQRDAVVDDAVAVGVELGQSGGDADDLDDPTVVR